MLTITNTGTLDATLVAVTSSELGGGENGKSPEK